MISACLHKKKMCMTKCETCKLVLTFNLFTWKTMASTFFWFVIKWRWVNDCIIFIFEWTILLNDKQAWLLYLKFFFNIGQGSQLIAELQGRQHRILIGQREVRWTGQSPVRIDTRAGVGERIVLLMIIAGVAGTKVVMWLLNASTLSQKNVHDLVFVTMRC